jgi:hypothetical protein
MDPVRLTITPNLPASNTRTPTNISGSSPRQEERAKNRDATTAASALNAVPKTTFNGL